jgi:hypothetical protein
MSATDLLRLTTSASSEGISYSDDECENESIAVDSILQSAISIFGEFV